MRTTFFLGKERPVWLAALAVLALMVLSLVVNWGFLIREYLLLAAVLMTVLFARGDLRRLWTLPSLLLLTYVAYMGLSAFWAVSGKFQLTQYVKLFPAAALFAALVLRGRMEKDYLRRVTAVVADVSALYAFAAVEAASTGVCARLFALLPDSTSENFQFTGERLYGLFVNSNVEAAVYAVGILFSLALLTEAENRGERVLRVVTASFCAFAFVLSFSMGAMLCFAAAVIVYLIAAGRTRGAALARMLELAVPAGAFSFLASRFFSTPGRPSALFFLPFVLLLLAAAASAALELTLSEKLAAALGAREKLLYGVVLGLVLVGAVYLALAARLSAPYTFGGALYRRMPLDAGAHTLVLDADGSVDVTVLSHSDIQVIAGGADVLYSGAAAGAAFTVPADSAEVVFTFTAAEGTTLRSVSVDGAKSVMLRYRLLPSFVAYRLQGTLTTSSSVALRRMLWRDGLRYWKLSPVFGHGLGAFETGITRVQDFDYQTKYPHNHYIQVLLEGGVVGFALFLGALLSLGAALWRRRRAMREGQFAALYAAFAAEFVMNALQMLWDVQMSNAVFLAEVFALYALIALTCAEPLGSKARAEDAARPAAKPVRRRRGAKAAVKPGVRAAALIFPVFVLVTTLGNMAAQKLMRSQPETFDLYLQNQETAARIDLYEHNDALLTYVLQAAAYGATEHFEQADRYAARLAALPSNSIHYFLLEYYNNTRQYDKMLDLPLKSAIYAASDESMWNDIIDILKQVFADTGFESPLVENADTLLPKLLAYRQAWLDRCASAPVPIRLTEENQAFFDELLLLDEYRGDPGAIGGILYAHAAYSNS